jgi:hypothetical protein
VSPITAYVRRVDEPISPAKTQPRLMPAASATGGAASTIDRTVRSIRSSSPPALPGAPATR